MVGVAQLFSSGATLKPSLGATDPRTVGRRDEGNRAHQSDSRVMTPLLPGATRRPASVVGLCQLSNVASVVDHQDRTVAAVNNEPSLRREFCKAPCEREFRRRRVHGRSPVSGPQILVIPRLIEESGKGLRLEIGRIRMAA